MKLGFATVVEQGWHARQFNRVSQDACPYPPMSGSGKEWLSGWFCAERGEHWNKLNLRKSKKEKVRD